MQQTRAFWIVLLIVVLAGCDLQLAAQEVQPTSTQQTRPTAIAVEPTEAPTSTPVRVSLPDNPAAPPGSRLQIVQSRGTLICGINGSLPGFSYQEPDGSYSGFDADFCRAIAAAVLGNADAVEFRPLTAQERFAALKAGEVDILLRNTTWTLSRDTSEGIDFGPTIFYDNQTIMVHADSGIIRLEGLRGRSICVQSGTTTEQNLTEQLSRLRIEFEPVVFDEVEQVFVSYENGRCDAITSDRSQLISRRTMLEDPSTHVILKAILSKEPLGPAVAHGDNQWRDIISWAIFATIEAEELGIDSFNVREELRSGNPSVRRFLGVEGELGASLGLANDFAATIIASVGNYGEIYERNMGMNTPFSMDRGMNRLWEDGGLLYSPPFR